MRSLPPIVKNLLIANVLVYLAQLYFRHTETPLELYGALWPLASGNFKIWQLVTHMFMHDSSGFFHILFNMFTLYMFGAQLEDVWGSKRFFNFYDFNSVRKFSRIVDPEDFTVGLMNAVNH